MISKTFVNWYIALNCYHGVMHFNICCLFTLPVNTNQAQISLPSRISISTFSVPNLLHWGQIHCLSCRLTFHMSNLINGICERPQHCILQYLDSAMVINHHLLVRVEFHACVACIFRKKLFSYGEMSLSEFEQSRIFCDFLC